jgi:hypothetical protein
MDNSMVDTVLLSNSSKVGCPIVVDALHILFHHCKLGCTASQEQEGWYDG